MWADHLPFESAFLWPISPSIASEHCIRHQPGERLSLTRSVFTIYTDFCGSIGFVYHRHYLCFYVDCYCSFSISFSIPFTFGPPLTLSDYDMGRGRAQSSSCYQFMQALCGTWSSILRQSVSRDAWSGQHTITCLTVMQVLKPPCVMKPRLYCPLWL
ncbi:hypothetical protein BX600DRAFT_143067 [Xylariales sp. PMI_506]|nr:hypothetical protein BX600DRAFT_143067 [Xylariales sp. PMI_506]